MGWGSGMNGKMMADGLQFRFETSLIDRHHQSDGAGRYVN